MMPASPNARGLALAFVVLGCRSAAVPEIGGSESSSASSNDTTSPNASTTSGGTSTSSSTDPGISSGSAASSSSSSSSSSTGGEVDVPGGFLEPPDGAPFECTTWDQNCPLGQKCTWWADDGGNSWNATRCTPIDADPDGIAEPCTAVDDALSGLDSCDLGLMCWYVDLATDTGRCVPFCVGSESSPVCEQPSTTCYVNDDGMGLCLPPCDPLAQDCAADELCVPLGEGFSCAFDAWPGDEGGFGDPCEYVNVCNPGLFCAPPPSVPGCASADGCCSPFCDLDAPSCPSGEQNCVAAYEAGDAPWGFEDVGFCEVP